jgi:phosphatidylinositol alpha-1,6-mannosyltransferase
MAGPLCGALVTTWARPRVLVITPDFPPVKGGIQILSHRIASSFRMLEPTVVTVDHPAAEAFDRMQTFEIVRVRRQPGRRAFTTLALNAGATRVALRDRPDVVLSTHIVVSPTAALLRRQLGIPFVQYVYAKEIGAKPQLARFALTRADRVVSISRYTTELAIAAGAPADRIALISPGVDAPAVTRTDRPLDGPPTVLTISRLEDRYKGHDVMLRALPLVRAEVPDVRWHIIGDGPLRQTLEDRAQALGLGDSVQFLGRVSDEARDEELARANAFCMVSRLPAGRFAGEGFGIVYLEANAHGVPVVAGAVGGATDAVVHGETGLLVDPQDHVAVADALVALLRDRDLAERLARAGRARVEGFTWEAAGGLVEAELLRVLT